MTEKTTVITSKSVCHAYHRRLWYQARMQRINTAQYILEEMTGTVDENRGLTQFQLHRGTRNGKKRRQAIDVKRFRAYTIFAHR